MRIGYSFEVSLGDVKCDLDTGEHSTDENFDHFTFWAYENNMRYILYLKQKKSEVVLAQFLVKSYVGTRSMTTEEYPADELIENFCEVAKVESLYQFRNLADVASC